MVTALGVADDRSQKYGADLFLVSGSGVSAAGTDR